MRRVVGLAAIIAFGAFIATFVFPSQGNPMAKIDSVKTALEKDDPAAIASAVEGYPSCAEGPPLALLPTQRSPRDTGCFAAIATAVGSKNGYNQRPADQASSTAIAIVLLRDGRGDWVGHSDDWLNTVKNGKGDGVDALRLAVARKMVEGAPLVGRKLEEEKDALAAMKAIAAAIPGACATYWLLGSGTDPSVIAAENTADHSACVHKDLARREGPGASYGAGTFRATEGALALWRETERALRIGLTNSTATTKTVLETKLAVIEKATQAIGTKRVASVNPESVVGALGEMHAEAGIILWKDDAGADGGDGGAGAVKEAGAHP